MNNSCKNADTITIDAATAKFFVGPPAISSKYAIYEEAVSRAYGDMSRHTLKYNAEQYQGNSKTANDKKEKLKNRVAKHLSDEEESVLKAQSASDYDIIHKKLCKMVSDIFTGDDGDGIHPLDATPQDCSDPEIRKKTFSMGQAQKVVNMVCKYVYLFYQYYHATDNRLFDLELAQFGKVITFLHAPVDGFVIEAATKKNTKYLDKRIDKPDSPWSQLNYEEYRSFQNDLRKELKKKNKCPFLWELENWPFQ